jgi:hypothetical protein
VPGHALTGALGLARTAKSYEQAELAERSFRELVDREQDGAKCAGALGRRRRRSGGKRSICRARDLNEAISSPSIAETWQNRAGSDNLGPNSVPMGGAPCEIVYKAVD